jgi:hypothetical protein
LADALTVLEFAIRLHRVSPAVSSEHALCKQLLELARQAGLTQNRFSILVLDLGQQLIDQFDRDETRRFLLSWLFGGHGIGHGISLSALFHDPKHTENLTGSVWRSQSVIGVTVIFGVRRREKKS